MIIKKVEVTPVNIPYVAGKPLKWAAGCLYAAEHLVVKIEGEGGTYGVAEATPRPMIYGETQHSIYYAIKNYLAPLLIGQDSFALENIWERMNSLMWNPSAKAAIDVALYDLNGKLLGLPIHTMLGGPYRKKVKLVWMVGFGSNDEMLDEMLRKTQEGFRVFKVKGGPDPDNDIRVLSLMKEKAPKDVKLYIDANMCYTQRDAERVLKALENVLDCIEEPMAAWDDEGRKEVSRKVNVPLLGDDSVFTYADVYRQVRLGALQQIGIKVPRTAFTISRKIVQLAEIANLPVRILTQAESTLGTAACLQLAAAYRQINQPCEMTFFLSVSGSLLKNDLVICNGEMEVPDKPGMGVEVDWAKVKQYTVAI